MLDKMQMESGNQIVVILPSLDPDEKLLAVVSGVIQKGFRKIVLVNDGSSAENVRYFEYAAEHPEVVVLTHEQNRGKGRALKTAFSYVYENYPNVAGVVTVDGDNQHTAKDIKACADRLQYGTTKVVLGCRNFNRKGVPARSRFGNKLTSFIFRILCGIHISDTQTGLRVFSRDVLPVLIATEGERFEYETEMFFALKRNGITWEEQEIETVYLEDNASSHFRVIRDSFKIYRILFRNIIK